MRPNSFVYPERLPPTTRLLFQQPQELRCVFITLQGGRAPEQEIHVLLLKSRHLILLSLPWTRRWRYVDPDAPKLLKQEVGGDDDSPRQEQSCFGVGSGCCTAGGLFLHALETS